VFADDSSICKAAFYLTRIGTDGGGITLQVVEGLERYPVGSPRNGVTPLGKNTPTDLAFKFITPEQSTVKVSESVEYLDGEKCWVRATVAKMKQIGNATMLTLTLATTETKTARWENDKGVVRKCGTFIQNSECKGSTNGSKIVRVQFLPSNTQKVSGWNADIGLPYGDRDGYT